MSHNLTLTRREAFEIDRGEIDAKDNANLQSNAETSHKKKADRISKEQYLSVLPTRIKNLHEDGDIHIHDLEYFGTRISQNVSTIKNKNESNLKILRL